MQLQFSWMSIICPLYGGVFVSCFLIVGFGVFISCFLIVGCVAASWFLFPDRHFDCGVFVSCFPIVVLSTICSICLQFFYRLFPPLEGLSQWNRAALFLFDFVLSSCLISLIESYLLNCLKCLFGIYLALALFPTGEPLFKSRLPPQLGYLPGVLLVT